MSLLSHPDQYTTFTNLQKTFQSATLGTSARSANVPYDLLTFLGIAQGLDVEILPISWDIGLANVGEGGSAEISQSSIDVDTSFAFKHLKSTQAASQGVGPYEALIAEVCVLGHRSIRRHPFVNKLQGLCWDIRPESMSVWPVLVFEKTAHGDLERFMSCGAGVDMALEDRLRFCAEVAIAVTDLHKNGIVHGDIKPANVLIFEDRYLGVVPRVADFGYSTWLGGTTNLVYMPRSVPWTAPEWHHRGFNRISAFKMDAYSFGLLCLWLLFYRSDHIGNERPYDSLRFTQLTISSALGLVRGTTGLTDEQRDRLSKFFNLSLVRDPSARSSDFEQLRDLLTPNVVFQIPVNETLERDPNVFIKGFRINLSIIPLYQSHHLIRSQIASCLEDRVLNSSTSRLAMQHAASELSFCYTLGFGVGKDDVRASTLLRQAALTPQDLIVEVDKARKSSQRLPSRQSIYAQSVYHGHTSARVMVSYHLDNGSASNTESRLRKEVADVESVLGIKHQIIGILKSTLVRILELEKRWESAQEIQAEILRWPLGSLKASHPDVLGSKVSLASILRKQSKWIEAERLQTQVLATSLFELGLGHDITLTSMKQMALIFKGQWKWEQAERLANHALRIRRIDFGGEHPDTKRQLDDILTINDDRITSNRFEGNATKVIITVVFSRCSANNLNQFGQSCNSLQLPQAPGHIPRSADWQQQHAKDQKTERDFLQVLKHHREKLGGDHPLVLQYMIALANIYRRQQKWKDAENTVKDVVAIREKNNSHYALLSMDLLYLASIYTSQGRWKEAEKLQLRVIDGTTKTDDNAAEYLFILSHLSMTYSRQGRLDEAEALELRIMTGYTEHFDRDHHLVVNSMKALSAIYAQQGRLDEAEKLALQVVDSRKRNLESNSPVVLMGIDNLVKVYIKQQRWTEAEDLETPVVDQLKKVKGESHFSTLKAMHTLARIWYARGKQTEAFALLSTTVSLSEPTLGPSHPENARRKQLLNEWQSEVTRSSPVKNFEEARLSSESQDKRALESQNITTFSPRSTESKQDVWSSSITGPTEIDEFLSKKRYTKSEIDSKIAGYARLLNVNENTKQRLELMKGMLEDYALEKGT